MGFMVFCVVCKIWYYFVCNGIDDIFKIGFNWWCLFCNVSVFGMCMFVYVYILMRSYFMFGDFCSFVVKFDIDYIVFVFFLMFVNNIFSVRIFVSWILWFF